MILLLPVLLLLAGMLCAPAYWVSRRRGSESKWLPVAALPAVLVWSALTGAGYGAQSLANIVEVIWIAAAAVILCYVKVFVVDQRLQRPRQTTYYLMTLLALGAVLLRSLMPVLPE